MPVGPLSNGWSYRTGTEQVYELLRALSRDLGLWRRFVDDPTGVLERYELSAPQDVITSDARLARRPPAALFASALDWADFDRRHSSTDPACEHRLYRAYGSELWPALRGGKPVSRLIVPERHLGAMMRLLEAQQTPFVLSPFKATARPDDKKGGFANATGGRLALNAPDPGMIMLYVSVDGARAQIALLAEALGAERELGRALGYPECCITFFVDNFGRTGRTQGDLVPFSLRNTPQPPPYAFYGNNLARYFGVKLVHHFPCRYTCAASIAQGRRYLQVLAADAPELAQETRRLLSCPIVYSDAQGVFLLEEVEEVSGDGLAFNPQRIRATAETTPLYGVLRASDRLKVLDWERGELAFGRKNGAVDQIKTGVWCLTFDDGEGHG